MSPSARPFAEHRVPVVSPSVLNHRRAGRQTAIHPAEFPGKWPTTTNELGRDSRSGRVSMKLSRESLILLIVGLVDLLTTLVWVSHHGAQEGNPIFSYYLTMGPLWFIAMKMVCLLCPILIFEWARNHRPRVARVGARIAIAGYLLFYVVG